MIDNATGNETTPRLTLTVKQFADRVQVSMPTAYAMTEMEGFPVFRVGKKKLIPLASLERWIEEQAQSEACQQKVR